MFSSYKNKNQLIGYIGDRCEDGFNIFVIDSLTEKTIWSDFYENENAQDFIDKFATSSNLGDNIFKAFVVNGFQFKIHSSLYHTPYEFCRALKEKFDHFKIPSYFVSMRNFIASLMMISVRISVKFGETVVVVFPNKSTMNYCEFKFTPKGYELVQDKCFEMNLKAKPEVLRKQILGDSNPTKIIVAPHLSKKFKYEKVFKPFKYYTCSGCLVCHPEMFVMEACKWMMDKSYIRYHIPPTCVKSIHVLGCFGSDKHTLDILKIDIGEPLPIKKIVYFPKFIPELCVVYKDGIACWDGLITNGRDCHQNKLTVSIDENNFDNIYTVNICIDNIEKIPSKLAILNETKVPLIGFFDNTSVISVYKESKGYEYLDTWNGKFGEEMFVSFDQKQPKFGQAAMDVLKRKPGFVVFDLLKIMAMNPENVTTASHWGFKLTNDAKNPILIQFNNFCGGTRAATPAFLLALILRQQLKAIEQETQDKPTKIAVFIIEKSEYKEAGTKEEDKEDEMAKGGEEETSSEGSDNEEAEDMEDKTQEDEEGETNSEEAEDEEAENEEADEAGQVLVKLDDGMKRLKEGLIEACELLKVECIFVNEHVLLKYCNN